MERCIIERVRSGKKLFIFIGGGTNQREIAGTDSKHSIPFHHGLAIAVMPLIKQFARIFLETSILVVAVWSVCGAMAATV